MRLRVLPSMPEYRYVYTCPRCECHVVSNLRVVGEGMRPDGVICGHCECMYAWRPPEQRTQSFCKRFGSTPAEIEIKKAVWLASRR